MPDTLLTTKFFFPPLRQALVPRPHLVEKLGRGLSGPLTLISAPAGYGKTTLLSEWRAGPGRDFPAAWLSLDDGDNDPERFMVYLAAALEKVKTGLVSGTTRQLQLPQPPPMEAVLTSLLYELGSFSGNLVLILDDWHVITSLKSQKALSFLLNNLVANMHLVVLTRADPALPLARLRARSQLVEIRTGDLRFSPGEVVIFLNKVMGLALSPTDVDSLEHRTEGWIAGLQLAALSMQGRYDTDSFIQAFAGSHRYIIDYLVEDVIQRQNQGVQDFLLRTCILERLCSPLCDAVLENGITSDDPPQPGATLSCQQMLEYLERNNLFLTPLDDERKWYRYHPLFSEVLRARLQLMQTGEFHELHRRAAGWYEANRLIPEAMQHALSAGDFNLAAGILEQAGSAMLASGRWGQLLAWLNMLPAEVVRANPALGLFYAWGLVLTRQLEDVERRLMDVESALSQSSCENTLQLDWRGQISAVRGRAAYLRGDLKSAIQHSREGLELLPSEELTTRGILTMTLGLSYISIGELAEASRLLEEAHRVNQTARNQGLVLEAAGTLAQIQEAQGHLRKAASTYREILKISGGHANPNGVAAHLNLGNVLYEWRDLEDAERHLQAGLDMAQQIHMPDGVLLGCAWLARVKLAQGERESSADFMRQAEMQVQAFSQSTLNQYTAAWMAHLALMSGDRTAAEGWMGGGDLRPEEIQSNNLVVRKREYLVRVQMLLEQGKPVEAEACLEKLLEVAKSSGLIGCEVEILALKALSRKALGDSAGAIDALGLALQRGEPEGYTATFIDLGASMAELLRTAAGRGPVAGPAARLLALMDSGPRKQTPAPAPQPLVEPLSERELEVLCLVAAGKSNREIAAELVLATGTVKKHLSNIFGKLDAQSRTQCVARGRELGLL